MHTRVAWPLNFRVANPFPAAAGKGWDSWVSFPFAAARPRLLFE